MIKAAHPSWKRGSNPHSPRNSEYPENLYWTAYVDPKATGLVKYYRAIRYYAAKGM